MQLQTTQTCLVEVLMTQLCLLRIQSLAPRPLHYSRVYDPYGYISLSLLSGCSAGSPGTTEEPAPARPHGVAAHSYKLRWGLCFRSSHIGGLVCPDCFCLNELSLQTGFLASPSLLRHSVYWTGFLWLLCSRQPHMLNPRGDFFCPSPSCAPPPQLFYGLREWFSIIYVPYVLVDSGMKVISPDNIFF